MILIVVLRRCVAASVFFAISALIGLLSPRALSAQTLQHRYSFANNASDTVGAANGTLIGNAYITNGSLVLPGGGDSDNPEGYVSLPNGLVSNCASITVECWLTDIEGSVWAEAWCFGNSAAGPGQPPTGGTAYISLIPHSGANDFRGAFNLTGGDEVDVISPNSPMPLNVEEYAVLTYDLASATARLYLNGVQLASAAIPTNLSPANYGNTFNNWLGRDEFGGDPMFAGSIDELRIWSGAVSPLYIAVSAMAGPNVLVTNLTPNRVSISVNSTNMAASQNQQAVVSANFLQASNVPVTASATNWTSSNPNILTVSGNGVITAVSVGTATISAMLNGIKGTSPAITVVHTNRAAAITVAYWQFNNSANLGLDSGSFGNTLTAASGSPVYSSAGLFGGALYLDGASTMTTLSGAFPAAVPVGANPYTIAVWEKTDSGNPVDGGFVSWGSANQGNCNALRLSDSSDNPDSVDNYWWSNDFYVDGLADNPGDGNWHSIVATWDGTNQILYVDGSNVGARAPTPPNVQGTAFLVGQTVGDNNQFKGWIEDLLIASAALAPADIAIYQTGSWLSTSPAMPQLPTASPSNSVFAGTTVTLGASVAGAAPFQYQWQKNGTNISAATAAALVLSNTAASDSGTYDMIAGNYYGTNTSPALVLTVTLLTNLNPLSVSVVVTNTTMAVGQTQQAAVTENLLQVSNYPATASATNWTSSKPSVLSVSSNGLITAIGAGNATISATVHGVTGTSSSLIVSPLPPPIAYYPLDGDVLDYSGNGNNGVNSGATFVSPAYISSEAAAFNGNSYIQIPESIGTTGNGFTISMWVQTADTAGGPNWYSGEGLVDGEVAGVTTDFGTALVGGSFALGIGQPDTTLASTNLINDGNWHYLAATWNMTNGAMNVYVDGALGASGIGPTGPRVAPPNLRIGSIQTGVGGGFLNGAIDDVRLYNTEFSAKQIAALLGSYSAAPQVGVPFASPSNTVYAGTPISLKANVVGTPPYQYQWQKNGSDIPAATSAALTFSNAVVTNSGSYDVVVANASGTTISPTLAVTISPASKPIFAGEPTPANSTNYVGGLLTLSASVNGTLPIQLQWQQNGVNIPNAAGNTLTLVSLQTNAAGTYTLVASNPIGIVTSAPAEVIVLPQPNPATQNMVTYHNDNARSGADTNEVLLTLANVNVSTFGRLLQYVTDGLVIAQPLYVSGMVIPGLGAHNVVFAATENNTVYAFDADSNSGSNGGIIWKTNLGLAVSSFVDEFGNRGTGSYYPDIDPVVGITGTPVIDLASGTLYVDVHTREIGIATNYFHRIHAINITNGTERSYSPAAVTNSVTGVGIDSSNGIVRFNAKQHLQRPGLMLAGGNLYVAFGSYADTDPYHGWVVGFNASNLQSSANNVFCTTPNASTAVFGINAAEGGLWMGGDGPCADSSNNLYFVTGNGSFSASTNGGDYGDSFVKLSTTSNSMAIADYFTPYNQAAMAANDTDLGSGGAILLPDSVGSATHPHLMIGCGKDGTLRLVDRDNMGHFNPANDNQVVQEVPGAIAGSWSTPAYFNNQIYFQGNSDVMRAFFISNAVITPTPVSKSMVTFGGFASGGTPCISANGTNNAIVWALQSDGSGTGGAAILHAFNATNLAQELYNSGQNFPRDNPGSAIIMTTPTVVNGKVIVGTQYALSVYGNSVFVATPMISPAGGLFTNSTLVTLSDATPNASIYYTLDGTPPTTNSRAYTGPFNLTVSANVQAMAVIPGAVNSGVASASFINNAATGNGIGLLGQYFGNHTSANPFSGTPALVETNSTINFNWGMTGPNPAVGATNFTVRWTGSLEPQYSELYTFTTTADDGVRLYVNGQLLINDWFDKTSATTNSASMEMTAQQYYNLELDYYQKTNNASVSLSWSSPSTPIAIIPETQLFPFSNPPPAVVVTSPANGATNFTATASVTVSAEADATYNPITNVSFYANGNLLGSSANLPYTITATGMPAGNYVLAAVATDGSGASSTSAPVTITVSAGSGLPYGLTSNAKVNAFLNMPSANNGLVPALLSETGVFSNTAGRAPAAGLIPYAPNAPQWKDNATSSWLMAVPNNGGVITPAEQIQFQATNPWTFPSGSVFVKNFDLLVNETNSTVRRLETEILVRDNNGSVYGVNYKWRPDNSDADLLSASLSENILITNAAGVRTQNWYYASSSDCMECHNSPVAGSLTGINVLGISTRQLNGSMTYPATGVTDNQLRTLNRLGLFNPAINESAIASYTNLSAITNLAASAEQRVRSYLDANCAECHQPGGQGITWDARYNTPLAQQNITNYPAAFPLGISDGACVVKDKDIWRSVLVSRIDTTNQDIQMPDFRNLIDTNAVALITEWINSLPGIPALAPPAITPDGGSFVSSVAVALTPPDNNAIIYYTLDGSLPTTNSLRYTGPFELFSDTTLSASAFEANYNTGAANSALFLVQPLYFAGLSFLSNGEVQLGVIGAAGSNYVLQSSTNLIDWATVGTNTAQSNSFYMVAPVTTNFPAHFYRVIQQ